VEPTRVLVADDNEMYRAQLGRFVSSQPDMEVVGFASDGGEAVCLASLLQPDFVLMDLCMPVLDGYDAIQMVTSTYEAVKVIALTAHRTPGSESRCIEVGASAFLRKSDVDSQLIEMIRGLAGASPGPVYPGPPPGQA